MLPERAVLKESSTIILGKTLLFKSNALIRFTKKIWDRSNIFKGNLS